MHLATPVGPGELVATASSHSPGAHEVRRRARMWTPNERTPCDRAGCVAVEAAIVKVHIFWHGPQQVDESHTIRRCGVAPGTSTHSGPSSGDRTEWRG